MLQNRLVSVAVTEGYVAQFVVAFELFQHALAAVVLHIRGIEDLADRIDRLRAAGDGRDQVGHGGNVADKGRKIRLI